MANLKDTTVNGTVTTTSHGTSANWKTAYDWGNHASAGYASTSAVNAKGNPIPVTINGGAESWGNLASIDVSVDEMKADFVTTGGQKFSVVLQG